MNSTACFSDVVITTEHRRFAEFCDACRRYGYIGLCYGTPGVGKTLSARHYANWDQVEAYSPYRPVSKAELATLQGSDTIFYTPKVINSPRLIVHEINGWRHVLQLIPVKAIERQAQGALKRARKQDEHERLIEAIKALEKPSRERPKKLHLRLQQIAKRFNRQLESSPEPTTLVIIDEADRLKTASLEQVRDIFDQGGIGVVLIGMPGLEKRLSRYPQLYSRVGFVHEFRPLSADAVGDLFRHQWVPPGVSLPHEGLNDEDVLAAIIRITGGNFRLLHRLLTQIARLVEINALSRVTREVVDAARESLVIGTT